MEWKEVFKRHASWKAVSISGGSVRSILSGNDVHSDCKVDDKHVIYTMPDSKGYRWMSEALERARDSKQRFTVFHKNSVNNWSDLGHFCVSEISKKGSDNFYTLERVE